MSTSPAEIYPSVSEILSCLDSIKEDHLAVGKQCLVAGKGGLYAIDFFVVAILKHSLGLTKGFISLVGQFNFNPAAAVLRMQLDNLIKANYLINHRKDDNTPFLLALLEGKNFNKLTDKDGKKLSDQKLRYYAEKNFPWISRVYKETSKAIHFSGKHLTQICTDFDHKSRTATFCISSENEHWSEADMLDICTCFKQATSSLLKLIQELVKEKTFFIKEDTFRTH